MSSVNSSDTYIHDQHYYAVKALKLVSELCREHSIRYYMLAGSVLGAVRHNGFIPWDDDIDIGFLEEDYKRFRKVAIEAFPHHGFVFMDNNTIPSLPRRFGKIVREGGFGVIDCFRLIRVPDNELLQILHWNAKRFLNGLWKRKVLPPATHYNNIAEKIKWNTRSLIVLPITMFVPQESIECLLDWIDSHPGDSTRFVSNFYSIYSRKKERIPVEWLKEPSSLVFEGDEYPAPGNPDAYLTNLYGDYMTPPSEANRRPTHSFNSFSS